MSARFFASDPHFLPVTLVLGDPSPIDPGAERFRKTDGLNVIGKRESTAEQAGFRGDRLSRSTTPSSITFP
jgi:hypothetical protein